MTLIKSISGIRGTIGGPSGENLTPPDVVKFTTAYVRLIAPRTQGRRPRIVVGRDARISGRLVADLVEGTLLASGADVIDVGLCTTPGTEMAVITKHADGGIIITASHNPRQWNALKLLNADGEFLSAAEGQKVLALSEEEGFDYPAIDGIGRVEERTDYNDEHIRRVLELPLVDVEAVRRRRYKVVVDAVNSVGGVVMPRLLREGVPRAVRAGQRVGKPSRREHHRPRPDFPAGDQRSGAPAVLDNQSGAVPAYYLHVQPAELIFKRVNHVARLVGNRETALSALGFQRNSQPLEILHHVRGGALRKRAVKEPGVSRNVFQHGLGIAVVRDVAAPLAGDKDLLAGLVHVFQHRHLMPLPHGGTRRPQSCRACAPDYQYIKHLSCKRRCCPRGSPACGRSAPRGSGCGWKRLR